MAFFLERQKTGSTPYVLINEERGYMTFKGECFHENSTDFFREINDWLKCYLKTDFGVFVFDFELEYFNSSTAKLLLNMLMDMDEHVSDDNKIIVNWITTEDDDIIIECGEEYKEDLENLEFNMVLK